MCYNTGLIAQVVITSEEGIWVFGGQGRERDSLFTEFPFVPLDFILPDFYLFKNIN